MDRDYNWVDVRITRINETLGMMENVLYETTIDLDNALDTDDSDYANFLINFQKDTVQGLNNLFEDIRDKLRGISNQVIEQSKIKPCGRKEK